MADRTYRRAARVILFDPAGRVLLSHDTGAAGAMDADDTADWWVLPGGGLEPGETPADAALREVQEESGFTDVRLGPVVIRHRFQMRFFGHDIDQDEWIFVGWTAGGEPDMAGITPDERTFMGGFQWLTPTRLAALTDTVYPLGLQALVTSILQDGPPATPWLLGSPPG